MQRHCLVNAIKILRDCLFRLWQESNIKIWINALLRRDLLGQAMRQCGTWFPFFASSFVFQYLSIDQCAIYLAITYIFCSDATARTYQVIIIIGSNVVMFANLLICISPRFGNHFYFVRCFIPLLLFLTIRNLLAAHCEKVSTRMYNITILKDEWQNEWAIFAIHLMRRCKREKMSADGWKSETQANCNLNFYVYVYLFQLIKQQQYLHYLRAQFY